MLSLLLKALAGLPEEVDFRLRVLGDGRLANRWRRLADKLGILDRIEWLGHRPHQEALEHYSWADVFVFSSLRDTSGNVLLESLAAGLPIIYLDHQGAHDIVNSRCGIPIPVSSPAQVVRDMSRALSEVNADEDRRQRLCRGALTRSRDYAWDVQSRAMSEIYHEVLAATNDSPSSHSFLTTAVLSDREEATV